MLKLTEAIAKANMVTDKDAIDKLDAVLIGQATNGVTIIDALKGHCPGPASNPVFIDQVVNSLKGHDNVAVTPGSPLQTIIHQTTDEPKEAAK